jgi:hypothetical protein
MPYKTKLLLSALLITTLTCILSHSSYAQDGEKPRGYKGPINKEELMKQLRRNEYVEGYIINGSDIISIVKETNIDIKIKNSIMEGGLFFGELSEINNSIDIIESEIKLIPYHYFSLKSGYFHLGYSDSV